MASTGWRRGLVLAGLTAGMFAALAWHWDDPVHRFFVVRAGETWSFWLAKTAYYAGLGGVQGGAMGLLALAAWLLGRRGLLLDGMGGLGAVLGAGACVQIVKHLVGRPRPRMSLPAWEFFGPSLSSDLHSFPSGHAATSFALAALLCAFHPRLVWVIYPAAILICLGRVVGGSHYLSDTLGGALLGLLVGWPLAAALRRWREERA
ncbi:MAG: phosphatase PAP2 family protein [Desulfarculus sp.]|nr:phosphatase PAP2 family protein [Desulfarculus sp.]